MGQGGHMGPPLRESLDALSREKNPKNYYRGLLDLARDLEGEGEARLALQFYEEIKTNAPTEKLRGEAERLQGEILGKGDRFSRVEGILREIPKTTVDWGLAGTMLGAGFVNKLSRAGALRGFKSWTGLKEVIGGKGVIGLSRLVGFGAEGPAFAGFGMGIASLKDEPVDMSWRGFLAGTVSGYAFLGPVKTFGWVGRKGFDKFLRVDPRGPARADPWVRPYGNYPITEQIAQLGSFAKFTRGVNHQTWLFGGILAGHELEARAAGHDPLRGEAAFWEGLRTLTSLNVAGLGLRVLGAPLKPFEQKLEREFYEYARAHDPLYLQAVREFIRRGTPHARGGRSMWVPHTALPGGHMGPPLQEIIGTIPVGADPRVCPPPPKRGGHTGLPLQVMMENHGEGGGSGKVIPIKDFVRPATASQKDALAPQHQFALESFLRGMGIRSASSHEKDWLPLPLARNHLQTHREAFRDFFTGKEFTDFSSKEFDALAEALGGEHAKVLTKPELKDVLVANRGEIALRILRGLKAEGIGGYVIHSEGDAKQSWVARAQALGAELYEIEGHSAGESYLDMKKVIDAAKLLGVQGVHPGYGFLSENPKFARALRGANLVLLGPSAESMEKAGPKDDFKQAAKAAGVPVAEGTRKGYTDLEGLVTELTQLGLIKDGEVKITLRLKAVAGGGGRGQATVKTLAELRRVFGRISGEAKAAFGDGEIMAEVFVPSFHHVEFQIMADRFGNVIHLGERECTLQERDQKLIEIHPAEIFKKFPELREAMADAAIRAARAVGYTGHGTVEFMVNPKTGEFFALEINTRIQVEHRVSELVTGVDLIREQIRVSKGLPLSVRQAEIRPQGAAIEIRLKTHTPVPMTAFQILGTADFVSLESQGIFVENTIQAGDTPSQYFDPMFAKILVTAPSRSEALRKAIYALERTIIEGKPGFSTDLKRQLALLKTRAVWEASYDNNFVSKWARLGGEDLSSFPYAEHGWVHQNGETPIYFEVGSQDPLKAAVVKKIQGAFRRLLKAEEAGEDFRLTGSLAEKIRGDEDLIKFLSRPQQNGDEAAWVQVSPDGELRQMVLFTKHQPHAIFLFNYLENKVSPLEGLPGIDSVLTQLEFPQPGVTPTVRLYAYHEGTNALQSLGTFGEELLGKKPGYGFEASPDGRRFRFFDDSHTLHVQFVPTRSRTAVEVRDHAGNYLISLAPQELIRNPGQRLLALFDLAGRHNISEILKGRAQQQIPEFISRLSEMDPFHPDRVASVEALGHAPTSLVRQLVELGLKTDSVKERQFLDEVQAWREIEGHDFRHQLDHYKALDDHYSVVHFSERPADGPPISRLMIRSHAKKGGLVLGTLEGALGHLKEQKKIYPESKYNVIQIVGQYSSDMPYDQTFFLLLESQIEKALETHPAENLDLKRITFIFQKPGEYPNYFTYRRAKDAFGYRTGEFREDHRYRNVHPMLAHLIELGRWDLFDRKRDLKNSHRFVHVFSAKNKAADDVRLIALSLVPNAEVHRNKEGKLQNIPELREQFIQSAQALDASLAEKKNSGGKTDWKWNRIFLNVQENLEVSGEELLAYLEGLAQENKEVLERLHLEKVVVKARIQDKDSAQGLQALFHLSNPTGQKWIGEQRSPADVLIRPLDELKKRDQRQRMRGYPFAYHLNALWNKVAQTPVKFKEMDLEEHPPLDPKTGQVDYNSAQLVSVDGRPAGQNRASVVVGRVELDLGLKAPLEFFTIYGDLTMNKGSLTAEECARINALIRMAKQEGIPILWISASSGAGISRDREGSENLDAIAATAREIILAAHHQGVPIHTVIDDINIGGMAYWVALANMMVPTRGLNIYTERGSTSLTGPKAQVVAILSRLNLEEVGKKAREFYPEDAVSLAGFLKVHGVNGEGILGVKDLAEGLEKFTRHQYFTYTRQGEFITPRAEPPENLPSRDILSLPTGVDRLTGVTRTVADEIETIRTGGLGNLPAVVEAFRDPGSPEPIRLWGGLKDIFEKTPRLHWPIVGGDQIKANAVTSQKPGIQVVIEQIRGIPTMVIAPPVGPLTPLDSMIFAKALRKASGTLPVLILGSFSGFNADPLSMLMGQLSRGGAEIAKAMTEHEGPTVLVNLGNLVGGSMVVVSRQIRPPERQNEFSLIAVDKTKVQVVGGQLNAKVVETNRVLQLAANDPRVVEARKKADAAIPEDKAKLEAAAKQIRRQVIDEISDRLASEFDAYHSTQRAYQMGSIQEVVRPKELYATVLEALEANTKNFQRNQAALKSARNEIKGEESRRQVLDQLLKDPASFLTFLLEGIRNFSADPKEQREKLNQLGALLEGAKLVLNIDPGTDEGSGAGGSGELGGALGAGGRGPAVPP